jgi:hypothetical protein
MFIERFFFLFIAWQQKKQQAAGAARCKQIYCITKILLL